MVFLNLRILILFSQKFVQGEVMNPKMGLTTILKLVCEDCLSVKVLINQSY